MTWTRLVSLVLGGVIGSAAAGQREITSLDFDWRFHRGDIRGVLRTNSGVQLAATNNPISRYYDDRSWRKVRVPHDYIVEGSFDPKAEVQHGSLPVEPAWYRRTINIPESAQGRRLWIEFDGVYRDSRAWLNGQFLGRHESGYTSFRYDITDAVKVGGNNLLVVRVDPTDFEGWWYEGGGIYRHVRLISVAPVHIAPSGVQVISEMRDPGDRLPADARLAITTTVANDYATSVQVTVLSEIIDADDAPVAVERTSHKVAPKGAFDFRQSLALAKANLWSCETPYLYHVRTSVFVAPTAPADTGGKGNREIPQPKVPIKLVDQITTPFGVRTIRFDADRGFLLNGNPVKIKGTCNHQDFAGIGIALPGRIHEFRVRKLQDMGANAYRLSHHMMAPELLDACDRLGMLVMAENRHLGDSPEILGQLDALVRRDRNHPCIVIWSISNEEKEQGNDLGARQGRAMKEVIGRLDPTRPITAAMNNGYGAGLTSVIDVQGFNYHPQDYDSFHAKFPKMPVIATEIAAALGTRGIYARQSFTKDKARLEGDPNRSQMSAYGVNAMDWGQTTEGGWKPVAQRPWMAGGFVWSGFDYRGEPAPFDWPAVGTQYGIMDQCGFPKDAFYYYQSWWTDRPVLHIFPHWNWRGREGEEIPIWVYSNCESVELLLNGESLGMQTMPVNGHLEWNVKYAPGTLLARGRRGSTTLSNWVETTSAPAAVILEPDRNVLAADGSDISLVTVKIADDRGRTVPIATNLVTFTLSGAGQLLGVANGDPGCHEPDRGSQRSAFNGLCLAVIQAARTNGALTLKAESAGLKPATTSIEVRQQLRPTMVINNGARPNYSSK